MHAGKQTSVVTRPPLRSDSGVAPRPSLSLRPAVPRAPQSRAQGMRTPAGPRPAAHEPAAQPDRGGRPPLSTVGGTGPAQTCRTPDPGRPEAAIFSHPPHDVTRAPPLSFPFPAVLSARQTHAQSWLFLMLAMFEKGESEITWPCTLPEAIKRPGRKRELTGGARRRGS